MADEMDMLKQVRNILYDIRDELRNLRKMLEGAYGRNGP